jgi:hypothetical protein
MSAIALTLGQRYRPVLEDVETGERIDLPEAHYYGSEADDTDFTLRFSLLPPDERDEKRGAAQ